ncbi:quinone oxidoreductase family protein [Mycolicibacterium septicum]|uniref:quinone oxidoreductase family protein n=1 Tax=Mycolicibacterium septicum TaxID=98668 RepID=UPI0023618AB4|nr:zinc-binding alcohol dehydrogenase family protein [Mycolicibacterium septicum]
MKAAVVNTLGPAPVYADFADPEPGNGTVVATVEAAALKNIDRFLIGGTHYGSPGLRPPLVAGQDGVARLDDGRLVYVAGGVPPFGMMAERTLIDPSRAYEVPEGLDPVLAAAVPNPGVSAYWSLQWAGRIQPGSRVLIIGATGVAGSVATILAKSLFGAGRVVAAGRNTERLDWLRTVGADAVIELGADDVTARVAAEHDAQPFDLIIDMLWGEPVEQVLAALVKKTLQADYHVTRFVQVGASAGPTINLPAGTLRGAGIEMCGLGPSSIPAESLATVATEMLPTLFAMAADGRLPINAQPHPLSDVEKLWTAREPSGTRVVLVP